MKKENGITLIALIITIIVSLILAGVALVISTGDKGILENAKKATEETKRAQDKEAFDMADAALKIDVYKNKNNSNNNNNNNNNNKPIDWTKYYNEEKFNEYLGGNGTASNFVNNEDGTISFEYENSSGEKTKYEVDTDGKLSVNVLSNKISAANYGDKVQYVANGISDWRIFYKDGKNVFLISGDYIPNQFINIETTSLKRSNTYNVSWGTTPTFQTSNRLDLFKATQYILKADYKNSKYVSTLLNTDNWTSFVDSSVASCAIGTPTVEMWVASWNEKYSDTLSLGTATKGYKIGVNSSSLGSNISKDIMNVKDGYKVDEVNNMYYPHKQVVSGCYGYWLASPVYSTYNSNGEILENSNSIMNIEYDGLIGYSGGYADYCLRPVVCLKEDVGGRKINDVWILE